MTRPRAFSLVLVAALALALTFLTLPVVAIFANTGPGDLVASLGDASARDALRACGLHVGRVDEAGVDRALRELAYHACHIGLARADVREDLLRLRGG